MIGPHTPKAAVRDTQGTMTEESTTPDLVELARRVQEATNRRDVDDLMSFFAPDAVWDVPPMDLRVFEGRAAIRRFVEEWLGAYGDVAFEIEEVRDLGSGVGFEVFTQRGHPTGSTGEVHQRSARVVLVVDGLIERITSYIDIDEARAAAERLARGAGVGGVAGELMTPWASPSTDEMGETWGCRPTEAVHVLGL